MKKILALVLVLIMMLSLGSAAFAEDSSETYETMGLTLHYTEEFENTKGIFSPSPMGEIDQGIFLMPCSYTGMTQQDYNALMMKTADEVTEEEIDKYYASEAVLCYVFAINGGRGVEDIISIVGLSDYGEDCFTELGKADDFSFFAFEEPEETEAYLTNLEPEFADEFRTLQDALAEVLKNADFFVPVAPGAHMIGKTMSFETTDVYGNPVKSEELFAAHEVTMVNIWTTWCGPCKAELKELGEMHRSLAEKDAAVVGVCMDADGALDECKALMDENNIDYVNLLPSEGFDEDMEISAYPTSFFVGRDGKILTTPYIGNPGNIAVYEKIIDSALNGEFAAVED